MPQYLLYFLHIVQLR